MSERVNRRDLMVEVASRLFEENGYNGTSVRQIADEVGCTEAALYYHFKDGKRALLQAVIETEFPNLVELAGTCGTPSHTLGDLLACLAEVAEKAGRSSLRKARWIQAEFDKLTPDEQALIQGKHLELHHRLCELLTPHISSEQLDAVAWLLACSVFGYGQIFWNLQMEKLSDFSHQDLMRVLTLAFGK